MIVEIMKDEKELIIESLKLNLKCQNTNRMKESIKATKIRLLIKKFEVN